MDTSPIEDQYLFHSNVGVTRFGVVKLAYSVPEPQKSVLVKIIDPNRIKKYSFDVMQEIWLMQKTKSHHMARVLKLFKNNEMIYVVYKSNQQLQIS